MRDGYERPDVTVDIVPLTLAADRLSVLLLARDTDPFAGRRALIGGYVHVPADADADATAARVLRGKAGLAGVFIEQLGTFSGPNRDPRGWSLSVTYLALVPLAQIEAALAADGALSLAPVDAAGPLPFDHDAILAAAVRRVRGKGAYSTLPASLLPGEFSLPELQRTYEAVLGTALDESSFRRKLTELDLVEPSGAHRQATGGRRAKLYRLRRPVGVFDRRI